MKCFYHPQIDAVGICPQCGKTGCSACLTDLGGALICAGCLTLAEQQQQAEEEQALREKAALEQQAVLDRHAEIEGAKRRIQWSWIVAGVGFFIGALIGPGMVQSRNAGIGWLPGIVIGAVLYSYLFWSMYWSVPVVWKWTKSVGKFTGFEWLDDNLLVSVFVLAFCCSIPFTVAIYYGVFGGAIYQFLKYRRVAAQVIN